MCLSTCTPHKTAAPDGFWDDVLDKDFGQLKGLGAVLGPLGTSWDGSWDGVWAILGPLVAILVPFGGGLGASWSGLLGPVLQLLSGFLGCSRGFLVTSWGGLGALLGCSLGPLGLS